LLYGYIVFI